jgi:hypothetical protein
MLNKSSILVGHQGYLSELLRVNAGCTVLGSQLGVQFLGARSERSKSKYAWKSVPDAFSKVPIASF